MGLEPEGNALRVQSFHGLAELVLELLLRAGIRPSEQVQESPAGGELSISAVGAVLAAPVERAGFRLRQVFPEKPLAALEPLQVVRVLVVEGDDEDQGAVCVQLVISDQLLRHGQCPLVSLQIRLEPDPVAGIEPRGLCHLEEQVVLAVVCHDIRARDHVGQPGDPDGALEHGLLPKARELPLVVHVVHGGQAWLFFERWQVQVLPDVFRVLELDLLEGLGRGGVVLVGVRAPHTQHVEEEGKQGSSDSTNDDGQKEAIRVHGCSLSFMWTFIG